LVAVAFCSLARIFFAEPRGTHRPRRRDSCRIPSPASPDQAVLRTRTSRETQLAASGGRSDAVVAAAAETLGSPQPQETARRPARFRIWTFPRLKRTSPWAWRRPAAALTLVLCTPSMAPKSD